MRDAPKLGIHEAETSTDSSITRRHGSCIESFLNTDDVFRENFPRSSRLAGYEKETSGRSTRAEHVLAVVGHWSFGSSSCTSFRGFARFWRLGGAVFFDAGVKAENMKKLEAVIRHYKLEDVKTKLTSIGVQGMTVSEVRGFGRQRGHKETYRGAEYTVDFMPKVKMEVVVNDNEVEAAINAICEAARTGQIGDGKIFISSLEGVVRIRTGETGTDAI